MKARCAIPVAVAVFVGACGAPRVDTSSEKRMQQSLSEVRESLPPDRRNEFDAAIQTLSMSQVDFAALFTSGTAPDADKIARDMKSALEGKTAEEILEAADRVIAAQKAKERERALAEIAELLKERDATRKAQAELARFEILRSRYYKERDYFGSMEPRIFLRVRNGTKFPVAQAYFVGRITSPGRSVPWLEEEFNYTIRGGLEPGEEAQWTLAPNQFSDWGTVKPPADAGLEVAVTRLDGPDGEAVLSIQEFTAEDEARLAALQKEYGS